MIFKEETDRPDDKAATHRDDCHNATRNMTITHSPTTQNEEEIIRDAAAFEMKRTKTLNVPKKADRVGPEISWWWTRGLVFLNCAPGRNRIQWDRPLFAF
jgi:hypothetical protein